MTDAARFFAADLGASGGRTAIVHLENGRITLEETHRFGNGPLERDGGLYWDVEDLLGQIVVGLREAARRADRLDGIGIDTWGVDYALLDKQGELVELPRHYRDPRTTGIMERAFQRVPKAEIYRRTGIQFMALNTIYQLLAEVESGSDLLNRADRLLFMPDYLRYRLTGEASSEETIASTSQLYDPAAGQWAGELMDRLGIPSRIMPRVNPPGTVIGPLVESIAAEAGLKQATSVIASAGHDTAAAVAAVPATYGDSGSPTNWAYISSGTWSLVGLELDRPLRTDATLADDFTNEVGVCGKVRFLRNVAGLWLVQECQRNWAEQGQDVSFADLTDMAAGVEPFRSLIDPDDPVFGPPGDMPERIGEWCADTGQPQPVSVGQVVRCILESLALRYRGVIRRLEHHAGRPIEVIHMVGGGIRNKLLNQFTADACGRPVVAGPVEATTIGNATVQAMAAGHVRSLSELRTIVARSFPLARYEPQDTDAWICAEERMRTLLAAG
ncbi:MAG: rhamnulokinase [Phycisphaerales bacterium]|nr:MAG: rhamnulokinase [Phycisphaerales bacterium]